jgi:hypothetical protein
VAQPKVVERALFEAWPLVADFLQRELDNFP